jgi:uncharacterized protein (TIGR02996 family)
MTDEAALLAAITAHPDEDTPRLMYADWLEEHDQPDRAEFIRLRCAVEAGTADDEVADDKRAFELEELHRAEWLAGLPQSDDVWWLFCRGFPEVLRVTGKRFLERYESFVRAPLLRCLLLHKVYASTAESLVSRPWNPGWIELELIGGWSNNFTYDVPSGSAVIAIINCPQVRQLRKLRFGLFEYDQDVIQALATSANLANLSSLGFGDVPPDDPRFAPVRERFGDRFVIFD